MDRMKRGSQRCDAQGCCLLSFHIVKQNAEKVIIFNLFPSVAGLPSTAGVSS